MRDARSGGRDAHLDRRRRMPPQDAGGMVARLVLATTMALSGIVAFPAPARADVASDIEEARERCAELYDQAEVANEELNGTQVRLDELSARIDEIETDVRDDKASLRAQMRERYKGGDITGWGAVIRADSLEGMIDNAEYSLKVQEDNRSNILAVLESTRELRQARDDMTVLRDEQKARKEDLDAKVAEANDYMAGLTQELRDQLGVNDLSASWKVPEVITSGTGEAWRDVVLTAAYANLGGSYIYGGSDFRACDCSGLTMWCYAKAGIGLSHYSEAQASFCNKSLSEAVPGDVVWRPGHVGLYIGNGVTIEAHNPSMGITYGSLSSFSACGSPV